MGILEGKKILVTGVTLNTSIAYAVAEIAQQEGAEGIVSNFGRGMSLTAWCRSSTRFRRCST